MSAHILDGKNLALKLKEELKLQIASLKHQRALTPRIASIVVGEDPGSLSYALSQQKSAEGVGIHYELQRLSENDSQDRLIELINNLNRLSDIHGIILNKPLPKHIDFKICIEAIAPLKDIEGMTLTNLGRLFLGNSAIVPCTPAAVIALLKSSGVSLKGKEAVVIGRSEIVGKPVAFLLLDEQITTTICHSATTQAGKLDEHLQRADIIIAAIGKPSFIKADWIKPGAIVIDVGINQVEGKIVGDIDYAQCSLKAGFITPVPGGVGPVTSVMLMKNTLAAFKQQLSI